MRKYLTVILCALMLCSCADSTAEETESVTIPSETTAVPSVIVTENTTSVQTEPSLTEASPEESVTEKQGNKHGLYSYDDRVQDYMEQLTALDSFMEIIPQAAECLICDIDSNGVPDVVVEIAAVRTLSAVFSVDDEGAFMAEPVGGTAFTDSDTWRSYDGKVPQSFIMLGQDRYFAECATGGSAAGQGGIIELKLNGRQLSSEYMGEWSYGLHSYTYRGFENEEQYNDHIRTCFSRFEPQWKLMPRRDFRGLKIPVSENHVTVLLEDYYNDRDELARIEEQLDDDLSYEIVALPVLEKVDVNTDLAWTYKYDYDYAGNKTYDSYDQLEYTYTYYPSGKIKTRASKGGGYTEYDEEGNAVNDDPPDELTYDEKGRIKTRTELERDYADDDYDVYRETEYFYKGDTDEVIKTISVYNGNTTEISYYENGLKVSLEWHDPDQEIITSKTYCYFTYTDDGLLSRLEETDAEGNLARTVTKEYDSENRLIREESAVTQYYWDYSDRCNDYVHSWVYNEKGLLAEECFQPWGDTLLYEYVYDEYGNLTEIINTNDADNDMVGYSKGRFVATYSYKFDFGGNVLERTEVSPSGDISITEYRAVRRLTALSS